MATPNLGNTCARKLSHPDIIYMIILVPVNQIDEYSVKNLFSNQLVYTDVKIGFYLINDVVEGKFSRGEMLSRIIGALWNVKRANKVYGLVYGFVYSSFTRD